MPSDLYQHVYTFLLENKFTKAAKEFIKQAKVVSTSDVVLCGVLDSGQLNRMARAPKQNGTRS